MITVIKTKGHWFISGLKYQNYCARGGALVVTEHMLLR